MDTGAIMAPRVVGDQMVNPISGCSCVRHALRHWSGWAALMLGAALVLGAAAIKAEIETALQTGDYTLTYQIKFTCK